MLPVTDDADWRQRTLDYMNLYRAIADLPPVTTDPARDAMAQACALMMHAEGSLSHSPGPNWPCYSQEGAQGAGNSNIAGTAAVQAVPLYMVDPGNPTTLGHRRWILSNSIGPTGLGSTDGFSCMWTLGGNGNAGKEWMAWPPPGDFPSGAIKPSWQSIDDTGWSFQSDSINLGNATVTITSDGQDLPVNVSVLLPNYGSAHAISIIPQGWTTQAGKSYHVVVSAGGQDIEYDVHVRDDC